MVLIGFDCILVGLCHRIQWHWRTHFSFSLLGTKAGLSKSVFEKDWAKSEQEVRLFFSRKWEERERFWRKAWWVERRAM